MLPYLKKEWVVQWECKKTFTKGINLNGCSGLNTSFSSVFSSYTFRDCVKKCKESFYIGFQSLWCMGVTVIGAIQWFETYDQISSSS